MLGRRPRVPLQLQSSPGRLCGSGSPRSPSPVSVCLRSCRHCYRASLHAQKWPVLHDKVYAHHTQSTEFSAASMGKANFFQASRFPSRQASHLIPCSVPKA